MSVYFITKMKRLEQIDVNITRYRISPPESTTNTSSKCTTTDIVLVNKKIMIKTPLALNKARKFPIAIISSSLLRLKKFLRPLLETINLIGKCKLHLSNIIMKQPNTIRMKRQLTFCGVTTYHFVCLIVFMCV